MTAKKKSRKIEVGDLVELQKEAQVYKFHKHPMEILQYLKDIENPKLVWHDEKNVPPETEQKYLVSDARDYFNTFGYRIRCIKIVGIVDAAEGWIPDKSVKVCFEGS